MRSSWLADKIEQWPTTRLLPYAKNARTHSDAQVAQIAASIAEFGFTNPILAGGDGVIVAGHGRWAAAQKLGISTAPVVVLDHLTPTQRRALVIADNRIAENAGWDSALLQIEITALQDDDFDLTLTGFDADALADLLAGEETSNEGQTDEDAVPGADGPEVSQPGDVWLCGKHRVHFRLIPGWKYAARSGSYHVGQGSVVGQPFSRGSLDEALQRACGTVRAQVHAAGY